VALLGLLDLSTAFDTVDHDVLIQRLEISFDVSGTALQWIRSFLSRRLQAITFSGVTSAYLPVMHGVPQGSVLGPLLYVLYAYTADVTAIAAIHSVRVHTYTDDTTTLHLLLCC